MVAIPVVAIGFFVLLVWLFYGRSRPPVAVTPPPDDQPGIQAEASGPRGTGPAQRADPNDSSQSNTQPGGPQTAIGPEPNEPNVPPVVVITPDELKASFTRTFMHEEILADVAFTMSLCYARAIQFASQSTPSDASFQSTLTLTPTERWATLIKNVNLGDWMPNIQGMTAETEAKKPQDFSIIELVELDTPEAAQKLLEKLSEVRITAGMPGKVTQTKQAARIVHALAQMHDPDIPMKLIDMIEKSGSRTAYLIVQALINARGGRGAAGAMLPLLSEVWERRDCAKWWRGNVPSWGGSQFVARPSRSRSSGRITSPPPPSPPPPTSKGTRADLWQPNPDVLKLLAVVAHFADKTVGALAQDNLPDSEALLKDLLDPPDIDLAEPNTVGADLLSSLQNVRESVRSRIRAEATNDIEASAKERKRWIRSSASTTTLQKIVVEMDVIADFIGLLIVASAADDAARTEVQDTLRKRTEVVGRAPTAMEQLRESCYYNFMLWHRLLELRLAGPVPDSPGR